MSYLLWLHEKVFSISEDYLAKKKSVHGRIVLLTFYSKWAKSKIVKLRILRVQLELVSNETQQLEVSIGILLKLFSFFFSIGIY